MAIRQPLEKRFWAKVDRRDQTECWPWLASKRGGYGRIIMPDKKNLISSRVAWELSFGPIPDGLHVLHRCDNPECCNPEHLFLGTHRDNMNDMMAKGRRAPQHNRKAA